MPSSLRQSARDMRVLGSGAAVRVAYEASKRGGGHALLFGRLLSTTSAPEVVSPFTVPADIPPGARDRNLAEAEEIVAGRVTLFGREVELGPRPDWHWVVEGEASWPSRPWWQIDIRSEARKADVKWSWELGRHRHLVVLARAVHLTGSPTFVSLLEAHLRSWLEQNPPEYGIHWYSNLEISLRAIAWLQVLALAGASLDPSVRGPMARVLRHSARHLVAELPYAISSMRNNHLLGDALGLVVLGAAFGDRWGAAWARLGDRIFVRHLRHLVRPDGSMIEDSLSYQRFVLEMVSVRVLLGDAPPDVVDSLSAGAQHLARLGALAGAVPQHGDWDEGRVLVGSRQRDVRGSVLLALSLSGAGALPEWRAAHDETAWYCGEGEAHEPQAAEQAGKDVGGAIGRAQSGPFTVWLKAGSGPSHGHADLCSSPIAYEDEWIIGDPGTGTYNGALEQRNYFRSSSAHSVLRVEGISQLEPHRSFRWLNTAQGRVGPPLRWSKGVVMWGWHDAYRRLEPARLVARVVMVADDGVTVADWVEGGDASFELSLPLGPGVVWRFPELHWPRGVLGLELPSGPRVSIGEQRPFSGWWSPTYGMVEPSVRLDLAGRVVGPVCWSVMRPGAAPGRVEDGVLCRGSVGLSVEFLPGLVQLRLQEGGVEQVALSTCP